MYKIVFFLLILTSTGFAGQFDFTGQLELETKLKFAHEETKTRGTFYSSGQKFLLFNSETQVLVDGEKKKRNFLRLKQGLSLGKKSEK